MELHGTMLSSETGTFCTWVLVDTAIHRCFSQNGVFKGTELPLNCPLFLKIEER